MSVKQCCAVAKLSPLPNSMHFPIQIEAKDNSSVPLDFESTGTNIIEFNTSGLDVGCRRSTPINKTSPLLDNLPRNATW